MSDTNMDARQLEEGIPDEAQRPIDPEDGKKELYAREKQCPGDGQRANVRETQRSNIRDALDRIFGGGHSRPATPSERIVKLARDRDILYDIIAHVTDEFKSETDDAHKAFLKTYMENLMGAKDAITERIRTLLSET